MKIPSHIPAILIISAIFFIAGLIVNDFPFFQIDPKIRPVELLNFAVVLLFGYWFQSYQRKKTASGSVIHKLLEQVANEIFSATNDILSIIEKENRSSSLSDDIKKNIHLKFKLIATNVDFIEKKIAVCNGQKKNKISNIKTIYQEFKDSIINDDFSTNAFVVNMEYIKKINDSSNIFKNFTRDCISDFVISI
jgi:hypothetical protein